MAIIAVIKSNVGTVTNSNAREIVINEPLDAKIEQAINKVQSIVLAPKILPTPISGFFKRTEEMVVTSSGIFVPTAIITKLTIPLFIPSIWLIVSTLFTSTIAPSPTASADTKNSAIICTHDCFTISTLGDSSLFFASLIFNIINPTKSNSKIIASNVLNFPFSPKNKSNITHKQKYIIFETKLLALILLGNNKNETPKTMVKLHTIEPIAVLMPTSSTPLKLEIKDTVVSGKVVAMATTVAPTTIGGILVFFARFTEDSTSISPPFKISTKPNINTTIHKKLVIVKFMR